MGQSRPLCLFSSFSHYNFKNTNWKSIAWCAWDLNPWPQDGRHRRNHGAMLAAKLWNVLKTSTHKLQFPTLKFLWNCTVDWKYKIKDKKDVIEGPFKTIIFLVSNSHFSVACFRLLLAAHLSVRSRPGLRDNHLRLGQWQLDHSKQNLDSNQHLWSQEELLQCPNAAKSKLE